MQKKTTKNLTKILKKLTGTSISWNAMKAITYTLVYWRMGDFKCMAKSFTLIKSWTGSLPELWISDLLYCHDVKFCVECTSHGVDRAASYQDCMCISGDSQILVHLGSGLVFGWSIVLKMWAIWILLSDHDLLLVSNWILTLTYNFESSKFNCASSSCHVLKQATVSPWIASPSCWYPTEANIQMLHFLVELLVWLCHSDVAKDVRNAASSSICSCNVLPSVLLPVLSSNQRLEP